VSDSLQVPSIYAIRAPITSATETAHFIQIFEPLQGAYSITITGLKLGTYTFSIRPFSQDGSAQPETVVSGMAGIGSTSTLQLHFASSPGSVPMVTLLATFQSTQADINNGLLLGFPMSRTGFFGQG
jgi:hypothetical protein